MTNMQSSKTINGGKGSVWIGNEEISYIVGFTSKITGTFEDIKMCGRSFTGQKNTGYAGEGTLTIYKTDSQLGKRLSNDLAKGLQPYTEIIALSADPESNGEERVRLKGVTFTEVTVAELNNGEVVQSEFPFKYEELEYIEEINK